MLSQDSEDEIRSRFGFELAMWLWQDGLNPRVRCAFGNVFSYLKEGRLFWYGDPSLSQESSNLDLGRRHSSFASLQTPVSYHNGRYHFVSYFHHHTIFYVNFFDPFKIFRHLKWVQHCRQRSGRKIEDQKRFVFFCLSIAGPKSTTNNHILFPK